MLLLSTPIPEITRNIKLIQPHTQCNSKSNYCYELASKEKGEMKENKSGGCLVGFLYKMVIPRFIKGLVKSTAFWRADVIVKSVIAKSAR